MLRVRGQGAVVAARDVEELLRPLVLREQSLAHRDGHEPVVGAVDEQRRAAGAGKVLAAAVLRAAEPARRDVGQHPLGDGGNIPIPMRTVILVDVNAQICTNLNRNWDKKLLESKQDIEELLRGTGALD